MDVDLDRLRQRVADYFKRELSDEEIARRYPGVMDPTKQFDARAVRAALLKKGGPVESSFVRYDYRPFDTRWLYWEGETKLLDRPRTEYEPHVFDGNLWLVSQQKPRREWGSLQVIANLGCLDLMDRGATCIPARLRDGGLGTDPSGTQRRPNLSLAAQRYLDALGLDVDDLFHYVVATLHDPEYRLANAGALRMDWPRIPLPGWPDGKSDGAADALAASAARGRQLATLLDSETPVTGVTTGATRHDLNAIAVPTTTQGGYMACDDFTVTAGWGHFGTSEAVMPGVGKAVERYYTDEERAALDDAASLLGDMTFDVHLNERAYWRNVPAAVWNYQLGGYQVLKKWLSYRESKVLGRSLLPEEVQHFTDTARRIGAILQLIDSQ